MKYVGHLPMHDPLYNYLCRCIMPRIGADGRCGFRVFANQSSHAVYIYEDRATGLRVVGKYFGDGKSDFEQAKRKMYREYNNLKEFRRYLGNCHYVAQALGCNENLNCLLVTEYCTGEALDTVITGAIYQHDSSRLFQKLSALGNFLATIHNSSALPVMVDFQKICRYFDMISNQLRYLAGSRKVEHLQHLCNFYRNSFKMYQDQEVLVHGDATPANFFFGDGMYVITFDLERMQRTDRLFDTGRIAGEIKHYFLYHTGNKYASEPFIGHFIWEYCGKFPDRERAFKSITERLPFYMGMTLLRIARNTYLSNDYRQKLIHEAELTLEKGTFQS